MKNYILSLALVVLTAIGANAQNTKGDWYVGTGDITNTAWTELSIQPTIGYAFADNYMIGMSLSQADSTEDMTLGLEGRYFYKGFFGYVGLNDFDFDQASIGVGKMFVFNNDMLFVDPKVVYDLGAETTNLQIGFGLRF
tara:strand:+ start:150 stop:566 length:417 start_codon:yes stop_codon:yes gene_type:complete